MENKLKFESLRGRIAGIRITENSAELMVRSSFDGELYKVAITHLVQVEKASQEGYYKLICSGNLFIPTDTVERIVHVPVAITHPGIYNPHRPLVPEKAIGAQITIN